MTDGVLVTSEAGNRNNTLDFNLYFSDVGEAAAGFSWNGDSFTGFAEFRTETGQDAHSLFADPKFVSAATRDFHLSASSPAIDSGSDTPSRFATMDFEGNTRPQGTHPDIGAFEFTGT